MREFFITFEVSIEFKTRTASGGGSFASGQRCPSCFTDRIRQSLIFQVYVAASALKVKEHQTVLVVCPLRSIIDDQIEEAKGMGMSASSLSDVTDDELRSAKFQLLFAPAEEVINNRFLEILKEDGTALHRNLTAVVVDESHTVETWTGKR